MIPKNSYHFSIDDVFDSLIEVSDKNIPLFEHPFFKFLKEVHLQYKVNISLHLFYQKIIGDGLKTLKRVIDLTKQLEDENWLFFSPHALAYETPPYAQSPAEQVDTFEKIYREIDRFAGKNTYTKYVRLHSYSESFELKKYFKSKGVEALFTTDREVGSYRMPERISDELMKRGYANYKGMNFIRTQFRVEFFTKEGKKQEEVLRKIKKAFLKYGFVIFYTHEINMLDKDAREMTKVMFDATKKLNLISVDKP